MAGLTRREAMGEVEFRSDMEATLVDFMGGDQAVCRAARVSTKGADSIDSETTEGLIRYLVRDHHGSPFEHSVFHWLIRVPTVVVWQLVRHRVASYNVESGRYRKLQPVFYLPPANRALVQSGKPGQYRFEAGTEHQHDLVTETLRRRSLEWWADYQLLTGSGICNEVARMGLPFNLYWSLYVTMNARALTNFLSLRTVATADSAVASYPQYEIAQLAALFEDDFAAQMPLTFRAWLHAGRRPI